MNQAALLLATLLKRTPLFRAFSDDDFHLLARFLRQRRLERGELLFQQGDPGDSMVIIGSGVLSVSVDGPAGPSALRELGPGDLIGEMACLDPGLRVATVSAAADALVFELSQDILRTLQQQAPTAAVAIVGGIIAQLTERLRETNQKIEGVLRRPGRLDISSIMPRVLVEPPKPPPPPQPYKGVLDLGPLRTARGLSERDLEILLSVAPPQLYPDGALLCQEGRPGSSCFLLARGAVEVVKTFSGTLRIMATLAPGAFVGQLALIDKSARSATVRAKGDAVVLSLSREDFEKLLSARSPLAIRFQEQVAVAGVRQLRMANERLQALLAAPTPSRLYRGQRDMAAELTDIETRLREWDMGTAKVR